MLYDYEEFYKKYPVNQHDDPIRHGFTAKLCRGRVFDVACGTGNLCDYYSGDYIGYDISHEAIKKAKSIRRESASFQQANALHVGFADFSKADTIVISEFLEHIKEDKNLFYSIKKTAKKGTRLIVSCPNGDRIPCDEHVRTLTVPELRKKLSPLGEVRFHNWEGFKHQIICTCDIGEQKLNEVSLVMVVKDEEKGLENAILSAVDYVDNIVIAVDDSSSDKTLEIAERYADTIKHFSWRDDFSWARNFAHEGVKTDWILFLDGHEYIDYCKNLEHYLMTSDGGLLCSIEMENGMIFRNPRIYKNGVHFEGAVHEKQMCGTTRNYPEILIKHDRLGHQSVEASKKREEQRNDMIPRIMTAQYNEDKTNTRACYHLGMHYQAKKKYRLAIKWYKRYLKHSKHKGERWFVCFHVACCQMALKHYFRAFWYTAHAEQESPNRWETKKLKGMLFFEDKQYNKAIEMFVYSLQPNTGEEYYKPWRLDFSGTYNIIGECFCRLSIYDKAAIAFDEASRRCTDKIRKEFLKKRADLLTNIVKKL